MRRDRRGRVARRWGPSLGDFSAGDDSRRRWRPDVGSRRLGRAGRSIRPLRIGSASRTADALQRALEIEVHVQSVATIALRRQSRESGGKLAVAVGWRIQLDAERGQPLASMRVADARIALVVAQLVLVSPAAGNRSDAVGRRRSRL